jgi:hypothetical protein
MNDATYLIASFPMLRFGDAPPFSVDTLRYRCQGVLNDEAFADLNAVLQGTPGNHPFTAEYHARDTQIRNAAAKVRAAAWGSEARYTEKMYSGYDVGLSRMVSEALARSNPLETEEGLAKARWQLVDELVGLDTFTLAHLYAYAVQLQINERFARLNTDAGEAAIEKFIQANDRSVVPT